MDQLIQFHSHRVKFKLKNASKVQQWLVQIATKYKKEIAELNYIFCSDNHLLKINKDFLNHDYYTDIITFDNNPIPSKKIMGDIFISIHRVKENAKQYGVSFDEELNRVVAHGLLHLCGLKDKTPADEKKMRRAEEEALVLVKRSVKNK